MARKRTLEDDLFALDALGDADIDTSDIPETTEFRGAQRARYFPLSQRSYDIRAIANWCIERAQKEGRHIGTLWLNKIVYIIYEKGIQELAIVLSSARLEAWKHGPVFREIYFDEKIEKDASPFKKFNTRSRQMEVAEESFLPEDISLFDSVWERYGHKSGTELRAITHRVGSPWYSVWTESEDGNLGLKIDVATILAVKAQGDGRKRTED